MKGKKRQWQDSDDEESVRTVSDTERDAGLLLWSHTHALLHMARPTCQLQLPVSVFCAIRLIAKHTQHRRHIARMHAHSSAHRQGQICRCAACIYTGSKWLQANTLGKRVGTFYCGISPLQAQAADCHDVGCFWHQAQSINNSQCFYFETKTFNVMAICCLRLQLGNHLMPILMQAAHPSVVLPCSLASVL